MLQILNGVYKNSLTDLKNLTGTTAITSQTAYYQACNSAFMMVSSGAFSYQQALRTVIQEVADKGATVSYPSGHVDKLDVAVRRSLLTGIGLASRQISEENSRLCECDLMEISAHSGARPSHASWQGQIVSLSGRRGYLSKSDIGYGTGAGFGGWNCRHDWYPFYEGISTRNHTQSDLDKLNAKDIEYNGKMYSEYEISQMLRKKEREIRALKREQVAYKTAISEGQTFLKSDLTALNGKIRDKSAQIQSFCNQTGYNRDRFREQNLKSKPINKMQYRENDNTQYRKGKLLKINSNIINVERRSGIMSIQQVPNSRHNLYVSTKVKNPEQAILYYENLITNVQNDIIFKIGSMKKPRYVIVDGNTQLAQGVIAAYDPSTNSIYIRDNTNTDEKMIAFQQQGGTGYLVCDDNPKSSLMHELMHWYRKQSAEKVAGKNYGEYLIKTQTEILDYFAKTNYNIEKEISKYAYKNMYTTNPSLREEPVVEFLTACHYKEQDEIMKTVLRKWFNE